MNPYDEPALSDAAAIERITPTQFQDVRALIANDLHRGRDAWPAVSWLAATRDLDAKQTILNELYLVLNGATSALLDADAAVDNFSSDVVFGRATRDRRRVGRAFDFATALHRSMSIEGETHQPPPSPGHGSVVADVTDSVAPAPMDLSFERTVDRRRETAERQAEREADLNRLGVTPGSGLPFWEMYMRRRRHKSWG